MIYYKWIHFHADLTLWMTNCRFMTSLKACVIISLIKTFTCCIVSFFYLKNSHKKQKGSLQVVWIEYYLRLNLSGRGPEMCRKTSKQMYSLCDQLLGALIYLHFIILILISS